MGSLIYQKETISEPEDMSKGTFKIEMQRKKNEKRTEYPVTMGANYTGVNIHITGVSENKKKRNRRNI